MNLNQPHCVLDEDDRSAVAHSGASNPPAPPPSLFTPSTTSFSDRGSYATVNLYSREQEGRRRGHDTGAAKAAAAGAGAGFVLGGTVAAGRAAKVRRRSSLSEGVCRGRLSHEDRDNGRRREATSRLCVFSPSSRSPFSQKKKPHGSAQLLAFNFWRLTAAAVSLSLLGRGRPLPRSPCRPPHSSPASTRNSALPREK
jgi:hypothetical protein